MPKQDQERRQPAVSSEMKTPTSGIFVFRIDPSKRGSAIKVFLAGVLALLLFGVVINSYVQLNEVYTDISSVNAELNILRSENVRMQTELEGKASVSNIKEYAENRLGLQKLDKSQMQYLEIQTEDEVIIEDGEQNIFVKIKHKFDEIVAYLRG